MPDGGETSRLSAAEIFTRVTEDARDELARAPSSLAFSGVVAGLTMGLTGLSVAAALAVQGNTQSAEFIALLFYPVGFVAVILGRGQLFTENTLYPVVLILDERRHVLTTARLWGIVFAANLAGVALFAALAVETGALSRQIVEELVTLGEDAVADSLWPTFWKGVVGGWLIALVAWLVSASHWTSGQFLVIWALTFIVGLGGFQHCVATAGEILAAVLEGPVPVADFAGWLAAVTTGNVAGGVGIVALLNYGQVRAGPDE